MLSLNFQLEELEDKDLKLRVISEEQEKKQRLQQLTSDKAQKNVMSIKKRLSHERNLKLDAFQRVDDLQTQVRGYRVGLGLLGEGKGSSD